MGYLGSREATPLILKGLKLLEYRGYDSAGVAVKNGKESLDLVKTAGRVEDLEGLVHDLQGSIGIGHTRWATHGAVTNDNAHPHMDCYGNIAIVHNGIIENSSDIRKKLLAEGHSFISDTDSEVIAHLIEQYETRPLEEAVMETLQHLEGTFGLVALSANDEKIVVARQESPLLIGVGDDEYFVASDPYAFLEHTNNVIYLDSGQIAVMSSDSLELFDTEKRKLTPQIEVLDASPEEIMLDGHVTFMHKEIHEQPEVMQRGINIGNYTERLTFDRKYLERMKRERIPITITGCGTSWHAALIGEHIIEEALGISVNVNYASELRYNSPLIREDDLVIGLSQSGYTADTNGALQVAKDMGARTLGIVNATHSDMARLVDDRIYINAGPEIGVASTKAFTGQVLALNMLALYMGEVLGYETDESLIQELHALPDNVRRALEMEDEIERIAGNYSGISNALFMGRLINFPTALEGALKLKEISYAHAEGLPAAEMKHGPIALIDKDMPSVFIANNGSTLFDKVLSNIEEVRSRGGEIISVTDCQNERLVELSDHVIYVPKTHGFLSPIVNAVPLQLFAYHVAMMKGKDVDKPRNLAKSVTVE